MKKTLAILILFLLPIIASAKPTYRITVQIDGATDSTLLLGYYYAQNRFILDTARNNGRGKFVFESEKELYPGLYFFTNNNDRLTEFIVYKEKPFFTLHTDNSAWTMKMKVKGSQQNDIFFAYQKESESVYQQIDSMRTKLDSASFADYQHRQHLRIDSIKNHYINHYPNAMFARMINATKNVDELVPVEHPDGTKLTDHERYMWYMHHYFDFIPIDDDFIIRTPKPVFYQRIVDYTDNTCAACHPKRSAPCSTPCSTVPSLPTRSSAGSCTISPKNTYRATSWSTMRYTSTSSSATLPRAVRPGTHRRPSTSRWNAPTSGNASWWVAKPPSWCSSTHFVAHTPCTASAANTPFSFSGAPPVATAAK